MNAWTARCGATCRRGACAARFQWIHSRGAGTTATALPAAATVARLSSGESAAAFYDEAELALPLGGCLHPEALEGRKVPAEGLRVDVYPFQTAGIAWMRQREAEAHGGLMCDHLGMGKTVQMLGLCAAQREAWERAKHQQQQPAAAGGAGRLVRRAAPGNITKKHQPQPSSSVNSADSSKADASASPPFGAKLLFIIRQMQRVAVIGNCTSIVRPGMELFALHERIEGKLRAFRDSRAPLNFAEDLAELEKWLQFSKAYHPPFERHARWFLDTSEARGAADFDINKSPEMRTLIVVPASLLHQWHSEIAGKMSRVCNVHVFHGSSKHIEAVELEVQDFVLTTYDTLTHQLPRSMRESHKRGAGRAAGGVCRGSKGAAVAAAGASEHERLDSAGPLFQVRWKRIILDEAHVVRHGNTARWRAVRALRGGKRWAVTATPVHNSIEDVQNLLEFVNAPTLPLLNSAKAVLTMDDNLQRVVAQTLQPLLIRRAPVMMLGGRRTELVRLSRITEDVVFMDLSEREAAVYNEILASKRAAIARSEHLSHRAMHIFALMTNLRQVCCHHWLSHTSDAVRGLYRCGLCGREAIDPTITPCGHAFCRECLHNRFVEAATAPPTAQNEGGGAESPAATTTKKGGTAPPPHAGHEEIAVRVPCPVCEVSVPQAALRKHHMTSREHITLLKSKTPFESSTKVEQLVTRILELARQSPEEKMVVFSHFTKFLDIIGVALENQGIEFARIDGTMGLRDRSTVITAFQRPGSTRVLLASKTASGVGLNLTMANHVVIVDPWWNPAIEEQAVHRCHRIGQQRDVTVERYIVRDTIEAYCFEISRKKRDFAKVVLNAATNQNEGTQQRVVSRLEHVVNNLTFLGQKPEARQQG